MSIWSDQRDRHVRHVAKKQGVDIPKDNPWGIAPTHDFTIDKRAVTYFDDHRLEIGAMLLAGSIAYMARKNPEILKSLIDGATITIGNVLDVPGEITDMR